MDGAGGKGQLSSTENLAWGAPGTGSSAPVHWCLPHQQRMPYEGDKNIWILLLSRESTEKQLFHIFSCICLVCSFFLWLRVPNGTYPEVSGLVCFVVCLFFVRNHYLFEKFSVKFSIQCTWIHWMSEQSDCWKHFAWSKLVIHDSRVEVIADILGQQKYIGELLSLTMLISRRV